MGNVVRFNYTYNKSTNSCEAFHLKLTKDTYIKICSSSQIEKIRREIWEKPELLRKEMIKYDVNQ
ncbi:Uncharacterized protein FWK35_00037406, partial [Aphis craccivora]